MNYLFLFSFAINNSVGHNFKKIYIELLFWLRCSLKRLINSTMNVNRLTQVNYLQEYAFSPLMHLV